MSHADYDIQSVAEITGGKVVRLFRNNTIRQLSIDSRKLQDPESVLFFALRGPRHDGHRYIRELYARGVRNFVVSELSENTDLLFEANIIEVSNPRQALQDLATWHRSKFNLNMVGITGSNGKTILKEWLYQLLQASFRIVRSPKSFNSQVGVPLSVWNIEQGDSLGLFEAGISQLGEMDALNRIIRPQIGIFINLREAHDAGFKDREEKAFEKLKLFRGSKTLIYQSDYPEINAAIERADWLDQVQMIRCSFTDPSADFYVSDLVRSGNNATAEIHHQDEIYKATIPFNDNGSTENALLCFAAALHLGEDRDALLHDLKTLQPVAMRLQLLEGINGCSIINDTYNSDLGSLEIALDFAGQQQFLKKKTLILSDILQSGKPFPELYQRVAAMCRHKQIDRLIGIGAEISEHAHFFESLDSTFYPTTEAFLAEFPFENFQRELILIKGARPFRFERISRILEQKTHETVLEINLEALVQNLNFFRTRISTTTELMAMVKAFSYGMGSMELAHLLAYNKISYLAVAYTDEGVELRNSGIQLPIMVMNPEISSYDTLVRYRLEPEIFSLRTLQAFINVCKTRMPDEPQPIHLKIDSGMHRLGFTKSDMDQLIGVLKDNTEVRVESVFTHLSAADNPAHDDFSRLQISRFNDCIRQLVKALGKPVKRHVLNSAGILRFPEYQFEMVRLGIGLYGYSDDPEMAIQLTPSSRMKTVISQIKHVQQDETVGYQRSGKLDKPSRIATIPVGYADGYSRKLGNGVGEMSINGYRARTVGNICMDMAMVDVSGIPCQEGDEVEIFGAVIPLEELAKKMDTIPYEVISSISRRVKRVYYHA